LAKASDIYAREMSHLQSTHKPVVENIRIIIVSDDHHMNAQPTFTRLLRPDEQTTVELRDLLESYCAVRQYDPAQYSLMLKHDILPAKMTVHTMARHYNIPRSGLLTITLTAKKLIPCAGMERTHRGRPMSHRCFMDNHVVRSSLKADKLGHIDMFTLGAIIAEVESDVGAHVYRGMSGDERYGQIIDAMYRSGEFSSNQEHTPQILTENCRDVGWNKHDTEFFMKLGVIP